MQTDLTFDQICTLLDAFCEMKHKEHQWGIEGTLMGLLSSSLHGLSDSVINVMVNHLNSIGQ